MEYACSEFLGYIASGKEQGAPVYTGGERHGTEGFFVQAKIFTEVKSDMQISGDEIFGPVAVLVKFKTNEGIQFLPLLAKFILF
jgi:aldehyde dehydrogenase (NAD+)